MLRSLTLVGLTSAFTMLGLATAADAPLPPGVDPLTGPEVSLEAQWQGRAGVGPRTPILVLAGHADSQGIEGSGTAGAAVDLHRSEPMDGRMRDELYWNLAVRDAVVAQGRQRGLNIRAYTPASLTIHDEDDPRTNWSVGRRHSAAGGYALEIHFDAYGPDGFGSGLIPALNRPLNRFDESLAIAFGRYPKRFRGGLGAPRRGISILEIGKLEGALEAGLRSPEGRQASLSTIARRITEALVLALPQSPPEAPLSSRPDGAGSAPRGMDRQTSSEDA
jgi:hypothetical protein